MNEELVAWPWLGEERTMKRIRLTFARAAVAAVLASLALALVVQVPASAAGCFAYGCAGYDPIYKSCTVSSTTSTQDSLVTLWNRYSYVCRSNWARAQLTPAAVAAGYKLQISIGTNDSRSVAEWVCYPAPSNTGSTYVPCNGYYSGSSVIYGDMVDGTNLTSAWATIYTANGTWVETLQVDQ
jgi:hypothetical protein